MKPFFGGLLLLLFTLTSPGQTTGIGTVHPDNRSILDIQSTTKGILIPRVTTVQRQAIDVGSTNGMLVYDINTISFWYYDDRDWLEIKSDINRDWYEYQDSLLWVGKNTGNVAVIA